MINKGYYHPTNVQEQLRLDLQAAQQVLSRCNQNVYHILDRKAAYRFFD
ncbi:hypothetical protein [Geobacillus sp. T6]|nr:hypothetical protein [Geobacillus sp. T6]